MLSKDTEWLRVVVDTAVDGVILIDARGSVLVFNPACERLFKYAPDEAIGHNIQMLMPPLCGTRDDSFAHYLGIGDPGGHGREILGRRKDGSIFPIELSIGETRRDGEPLYVGIIHDITERKQSEEQRRLFIEQLIASNEERGHFSHVASHDMQEHLRMVLSFGAMLAEEYGAQLDDRARQYLSISLEAARQMRELVDDLVEYERMADEVEHTAAFDTMGEMKLVLEGLKESIAATGAKIAVGALPDLTGSAVRFRRLMQNLLGNAIKYMPPGKKPSIRVSAHAEGCHWRFCVKDNGIGIDSAYFRQIFQPFKRLHGKSRYLGTGLGLAICEKIVAGFGGKIWVESAPGAGSCFHFTVRKRDGGP